MGAALLPALFPKNFFQYFLLVVGEGQLLPEGLLCSLAPLALRWADFSPFLLQAGVGQQR